MTQQGIVGQQVRSRGMTGSSTAGGSAPKGAASNKAADDLLDQGVRHRALLARHAELIREAVENVMRDEPEDLPAEGGGQPGENVADSSST